MDTKRVEHESDDLARERTRLAAERTVMAWIRTSLAMIGFGFGIDKIVESLRHSNLSFMARFESGVRWFGIGMVLLGIYAMWASLSDYRRILRAIATGVLMYGPERSGAPTVGKWLIIVGTFAFLNLLWRLVQ